MENLPVLKFNGSICSDYNGINRLFEFYHQAKEYTDVTLYLDFYHLNWIDANLCALLHSILYKLNVDNNLKFSADLNFLKDKFNVLFRNGFISDGETPDDRQSVVTLQTFDSKDKVGFINYIDQELLCNRGMPDFSVDQKDQILDSLIELFNNIDSHSQSIHPFFVCGQYFPKSKKVVFSMVDLGVGFLPPIQQKTNGRIQDWSDSIKWALVKRNTTKLCAPGGLGLTDLYSYCSKNNGVLQIITGDTFWSSNLSSTPLEYQKIEKYYVGTIINLHFNCN